ncbi:MAG: low molecular weight protein arginine phosphatase [Anaerolineae bacterium]|nr:low molecular weight protein arginine phosphatase [Anaerolineae bacterium]
MKTILFVCTANICRSPMAAGIMRDQLARLGLDSEVEVLSAGVWAEDGGRASSNGVAVLRLRGIDLAAHRSQPLTPALLRAANIVLVMEEAHRRSIFYMAPEQLSKVYLLSELAGGHSDVADPFGGSLEEYAATADELTALIEKGLPRLLKRIGVAAPGTSAA